MANAHLENRPSLSITRTCAASPEKVWRAWTDQEALKQWFGPDDGGPVLLAEVDVRVGGRYHIRFQTNDGQTHDVSGVYREVIPHEKLVFTWGWKSTPERESLVTVALRPSGAGTELRFLHERFVDVEARDQHEQGWTGSFAKLDLYLA